ncbi:MAG: trehalase family glycosidase [Acutalibacteraceae bacterium]|nr:trehalase family glycosidase [Acutalibacteraceae bacterium]
MLPKKWGQGQLFAFSAVDGKSFFNSDFTGTLSGDKIGVIFHTKCRRTLFFTDASPSLNCVASDVILLENASMIFAERHLVTGEINGNANVFVSLDGECEIIRKGDIEIHNTSDGEYTALLKRENRFVFAYGNSSDRVAELCERGISLDIEELKIKKSKPYENIIDNAEYAPLYAKCISVMKSQLYSPEGKIKRIWSTPDRLPHRNMWLWDSVFHAIGHRHLDAEFAENLILALFDVQQEDGFIPHMAKPEEISSVTQPPVIAWGAWLVYQKSGNKEFLKNVLKNNKDFLLWCQSNRRKTEKELYSWHTNPELNNRCDESGMDNSPRFDTNSDLYAIDFSCYMANETHFMQKIADELGDKDTADFFCQWHEKIKSEINSTLWCEEDGFYYDYDIKNNRFNKVQSVASFLPIFAGVCDKAQCEKLVSHLENPDEFGTEFPIPSISKKDESFGSDMWRGPVWINYNYMISKGLTEYGFGDSSEKIKEKTLAVINEWYNRTGTVYEFYDSENRTPPYCFNRKGAVVEPYDFRVKYQSIRDYGWSITLAFDLLNE